MAAPLPLTIVWPIVVCTGVQDSHGIEVTRESDTTAFVQLEVEYDLSVYSATTVHAVTAPAGGADVTASVVSLPLEVENRTGLKCDVQPRRSASYL
jgi:hypothetical protein